MQVVPRVYVIIFKTPEFSTHLAMSLTSEYRNTPYSPLDHSIDAKYTKHADTIVQQIRQIYETTNSRQDSTKAATNPKDTFNPGLCTATTLSFSIPPAICKFRSPSKQPEPSQTNAPLLIGHQRDGLPCHEHTQAVAQRAPLVPDRQARVATMALHSAQAQTSPRLCPGPYLGHQPSPIPCRS